MATGSLAVGTSRVQPPSQAVSTGLLLTASEFNGGPVFVSKSSSVTAGAAAATDGALLHPGHSLYFPAAAVSNANQLYLIAAESCFVSWAADEAQPSAGAGGGGGGSGTVTSVSVASANGVSGVVANPTTTPQVTLTLGAITPTTVKGNTITTGTGTLTLSTHTLTLAGNATVSGTNSGDQDLSAYLTAAAAASTYQPLGGSSPWFALRG